MKREAKLLLEKACDSLLVSIEFFNKPHDRGRVSSTLILLDHSFEMLLKAAILHRGGKIRERRKKETIGFDTCVRRGLSDSQIKFLSEEQVLVIQTINGLRDAAQHHLLDISEAQLYIHAQTGVTLFRDLLKEVFEQELVDHLPERVLPVSTKAPLDLTTLFESEVTEIKKLLAPGKRRKLEAEARLRPLALLNNTIEGEKGQPSSGELNRIEEQLCEGKNWKEVFKGVSAINMVAEASGPNFSLRLSKDEGTPIQLVPEGTPGASVVAVKRVNELDFYNLGAKQLGKKVGLTIPKVLAMIKHLDLQENDEYYKEVKIGSSIHKRYSQKAITVIKEELKRTNIDDVWRQYRSTV